MGGEVKLTASPALPAALLHPSDEQQLGSCHVWTLSQFKLRVARSLLKAAKSRKQ
jgi:hypothetical protein